jgi:hypothetical protein
VTAETPPPGLPYRRCPWWSDPSDDFYAQCAIYAGHGGDHENEHRIRWSGQRWEGDPQPVPLPAGVALAALECIRQEYGTGTMAHDTALRAIEDTAAARAAWARQPSPGPAELQFLLDGERTERLHRAGERDEARSDLRRMHRLALDVLATLPDSSARARRWHEQADAIIGRHSQPEPAPRADYIRMLAEYGLGEGPHPDGDSIVIDIAVPPGVTVNGIPLEDL